MKLRNAIEILTLHERGDPQTPLNELIDAIKLGIEAVHAIQKFRAGSDTKHLWRLPSETEE